MRKSLREASSLEFKGKRRGFGVRICSVAQPLNSCVTVKWGTKKKGGTIIISSSKPSGKIKLDRNSFLESLLEQISD